jgi:hypothetical protein
MHRTDDYLTAPLQQLHAALAEDATGREEVWARAVSRGLLQVRQALERHNAEGETPAGLFGEVDLTRPSLARQVSKLLQQHMDFLTSLQTLQADVDMAVRTFQPAAVVPTLSQPLPEPQGRPAIPAFGELRQRGQDLVTELEQHCKQEIDLVQESVTTDLGAGD